MRDLIHIDYMVCVLAFHRSGNDALHNLFLHNDVNRYRGQDADNEGGEHGREIEREHLGEIFHSQRQRPVPLARGKEQSVQ